MASTISEKVIIGIDPGTNVMGYGVISVLGKTPKLVSMGVIDLSKFSDRYMRLHRIHERVLSLVEQFSPDEFAIEAPFFGKNVQSMLKLGRAQGVAIAAALYRNIPIAEYAPLKVKQSITGNGAASKEQVAEMLRRMFGIDRDEMPKYLDATDALAVAVCHFYESSKPLSTKSYSSWKDFIAKNPDKVK
ncbi:MAG: crossover junction endodeoxyribonuclease RuvC [Muribaculaceae bacterium]|nr:crossover junction endodeoxyribonuclease RuvC [Muribaculaceae bacterium]